MEKLHQLGYVNGDIKLENMLFGLPGSDYERKLHLIDFGLCTKYKNEQGEHIKLVKTTRFIGNFSFCSLNTCRLYNKSRRDDFESIFYVLIYLLN